MRAWTAMLAIASGLMLSISASAIPNGDTWKQVCAAGKDNTYKCCQAKFDECTANLKSGTIAYGQCDAAYKSCESTRSSPVGQVVDPDLTKNPKLDPVRRPAVSPPVADRGRSPAQAP
jgi:hypothetical protein